MKKIVYILLGFSLFILLGILLYIGYFKYQEYVGDKKIDTFISQKAKIPKNEIILVKNTYRHSSKYVTWFSKDITTKSDFDKWKNEIKKTGKFYNGAPVPNEYKPKSEDCELIYNFSYEIENYGFDKNFIFYYVISGTSENSKKVIKENFAYPDIPFDYPEE